MTKKVKMKPVRELWRDVVGYKGSYQVSNLGRVRSVNKIVNKGKEFGDGHRTALRRGRVLKTHVSSSGYLTVCLSDKDVPRTAMVHRLVATCFIKQKRKDQTDVNHKNGKKTDNRAVNLEWMSRSENCRHAIFTGLASPRKGENHPSSKINFAIAAKIRSLRKEMSGAAIGRLLHVSTGTVTSVLRGERWVPELHSQKKKR